MLTRPEEFIACEEPRMSNGTDDDDDDEISDDVCNLVGLCRCVDIHPEYGLQPPPIA